MVKIGILGIAVVLLAMPFKNLKKEWLTLGENLGYLDMEMQLHMLEIFQTHLSESMEEEREEVKRQSKLSRILGVMSGIFLTVLLI